MHNSPNNQTLTPTAKLISFTTFLMIFFIFFPPLLAVSGESTPTVNSAEDSGQASLPGISETDGCEEAKKYFRKGMGLKDGSQEEIQAYLTTLDLCPAYSQAHNRLGEIFRNDGDLNRAEEHFKLAAADPDHAAPLNSLGEVYRMRGEYAAAAQAFMQALEIDPDFRRAQNNLKYVEKKLGKYDAYLSNPFQLLPPPIFSPIGGMTLGRGTTLVNFKYGQWSQHAKIEADSVAIQGTRKYEPVSRETEVDIETWILGLQYGLTDRLTIGATPKFLMKKTRVSAPEQGVDVESSVSGIGDTVFIMRYHLWGKMKSHISLTHFLTIPTGDEAAVDDSNEYANNVPLGSGGWGFAPGATATIGGGSATTHMGLSFTLPTNKISSRMDADLALNAKLFKALFAVAELNYEWIDRTERIQSIKPDQSPSGGDNREVVVTEAAGSSLFLSGGLQAFLPKGFRAEIGWQFPIYSNKYETPRFRIAGARYF